MVIDLETAALADQMPPPEYRLVSWDAHTLDDQGRYTKGSDMHQIGTMLRSCSTARLSSGAADFIAALEAKRLDAQGALQHSWLQQRP